MKILYIKTCDVAKPVLREMITAQNVYTFKTWKSVSKGPPIRMGH